MPELKYDNGDIEILTPFFPHEINVIQNFNGQIERCNWNEEA